MQIGAYKIYPIETGTFALDGGAMFGVIPKNLWQKSNPADAQNRIDLALRALLLKSHDKIILIDCGIGEKFDAKWSGIYKIDHSTHSLVNSLAKIHLTPDDITDVILSHLHFDHAGGVTYIKHGSLNLTFTNALHYVQEKQWLWALNPSQKDRASFLKENLVPLEKSGQLRLLTGYQSPFPEIEMPLMFGHTPAMQLVPIGDHKTSLLYTADLIPTRSHIPVPWIMAYDNNPMQTLKEKQKILKDAVKYKRILFFEHDPRYVASYVNFDSKKGYSAGTSFGASDFNDL